MSLHVSIPQIAITPEEDDDDDNESNLLNLIEALTDVEELIDDQSAPRKKCAKKKLKIKVIESDGYNTALEDVEASDEDDSSSAIVQHDCPISLDNLDLEQFVTEENYGISQKKSDDFQYTNMQSSKTNDSLQVLAVSEALEDAVLTDIEDFDTENEMEENDVEVYEFDFDNGEASQITTITDEFQDKQEIATDQTPHTPKLFPETLIEEEIKPRKKPPTFAQMMKGKSGQTKLRKKKRNKCHSKFNHEKEPNENAASVDALNKNTKTILPTNSLNYDSDIEEDKKIQFPVCKKTFAKNKLQLKLPEFEMNDKTDVEDFECDIDTNRRRMSVDSTLFQEQLDEMASCYSFTKDKNEAKTMSDLDIVEIKSNCSLDRDCEDAYKSNTHRSFDTEDFDEFQHDNSDDTGEEFFEGLSNDISRFPEIVLPPSTRTLILAEENKSLIPTVRILPLDGENISESDCEEKSTDGDSVHSETDLTTFPVRVSQSPQLPLYEMGNVEVSENAVNPFNKLLIEESVTDVEELDGDQSKMKNNVQKNTTFLSPKYTVANSIDHIDTKSETGAHTDFEFLDSSDDDAFSKIELQRSGRLSLKLKSPVLDLLGQTDTEDLWNSTDEEINYSRAETVTSLERTEMEENNDAISLKKSGEVSYLKGGSFFEFPNGKEFLSEPQQNFQDVMEAWEYFNHTCEFNISLLKGAEWTADEDTQKLSRPQPDTVKGDISVSSVYWPSVSYESILLPTQSSATRNSQEENSYARIDAMLEKMLLAVDEIKLSHDYHTNSLTLKPSPDALIEIPINKSKSKGLFTTTANIFVVPEDLSPEESKNGSKNEENTDTSKTDAEFSSSEYLDSHYTDDILFCNESEHTIEENFYEPINTHISRFSSEPDYIWYEGAFRNLSVVLEEEEDNYSIRDAKPKWSKHELGIKNDFDPSTSGDNTDYASESSQIVTSASTEESDSDMSDQMIKAEIKLMITSQEDGLDAIEVKSVKEITSQEEKKHKVKPDKPKKKVRLTKKLMNILDRQKSGSFVITPIKSDKQLSKPSFTIPRIFMRNSKTEESKQRSSSMNADIIAKPNDDFPLALRRQEDANKEQSSKVDLFANKPFYPVYTERIITSSTGTATTYVPPSEVTISEAYCNWSTENDFYRGKTAQTQSLIMHDDMLINTKIDPPAVAFSIIESKQFKTHETAVSSQYLGDNDNTSSEVVKDNDSLKTSAAENKVLLIEVETSDVWNTHIPEENLLEKYDTEESKEHSYDICQSEDSFKNPSTANATPQNIQNVSNVAKEVSTQKTITDVCKLTSEFLGWEQKNYEGYDISTFRDNMTQDAQSRPEQLSRIQQNGDDLFKNEEGSELHNTPLICETNAEEIKIPSMSICTIKASNDFLKKEKEVYDGFSVVKFPTAEMEENKNKSSGLQSDESQTETHSDEPSETTEKEKDEKITESEKKGEPPSEHIKSSKKNKKSGFMSFFRSKSKNRDAIEDNRNETTGPDHQKADNVDGKTKKNIIPSENESDQESSDVQIENMYTDAVKNSPTELKKTTEDFLMKELRNYHDAEYRKEGKKEMQPDRSLSEYSETDEKLDNAEEECLERKQESTEFEKDGSGRKKEKSVTFKFFKTKSKQDDKIEPKNGNITNVQRDSACNVSLENQKREATSEQNGNLTDISSSKNIEIPASKSEIINIESTNSSGKTENVLDMLHSSLKSNLNEQQKITEEMNSAEKTKKDSPTELKKTTEDFLIRELKNYHDVEYRKKGTTEIQPEGSLSKYSETDEKLDNAECIERKQESIQFEKDESGRKKEKGIFKFFKPKSKQNDKIELKNEDITDVQENSACHIPLENQKKVTGTIPEQNRKLTDISSSKNVEIPSSKTEIRNIESTNSSGKIENVLNMQHSPLKSKINEQQKITDKNREINIIEENLKNSPIEFKKTTEDFLIKELKNYHDVEYIKEGTKGVQPDRILSENSETDEKLKKAEEQCIERTHEPIQLGIDESETKKEKSGIFRFFKSKSKQNDKIETKNGNITNVQENSACNIPSENQKKVTETTQEQNDKLTDISSCKNVEIPSSKREIRNIESTKSSGETENVLDLLHSSLKSKMNEQPEITEVNRDTLREIIIAEESKKNSLTELKKYTEDFLIKELKNYHDVEYRKQGTKEIEQDKSLSKYSETNKKLDNAEEQCIEGEQESLQFEKDESGRKKGKSGIFKFFKTKSKQKDKIEPKKGNITNEQENSACNIPLENQKKVTETTPEQNGKLTDISSSKNVEIPSSNRKIRDIESTSSSGESENVLDMLQSTLKSKINEQQKITQENKETLREINIAEDGGSEKVVDNKDVSGLQVQNISNNFLRNEKILYDSNTASSIKLGEIKSQQHFVTQEGNELNNIVSTGTKEVKKYNTQKSEKYFVSVSAKTPMENNSNDENENVQKLLRASSNFLLNEKEKYEDNNFESSPRQINPEIMNEPKFITEKNFEMQNTQGTSKLVDEKIEISSSSISLKQETRSNIQMGDYETIRVENTSDDSKNQNNPDDEQRENSKVRNEQKINNMENKEDENTKSTRKSKYGILSYLKKKFSNEGLSKDFEDSITQEEQLMIHSELRDMTSGFLQEEQLRYEDFREKPSEKVTIESAEKPLEVKVGSKDKILVSAEMNKECENNQIFQEKTYEQKMNNMENKEDENTKSTRKSKYGILSYLKKKFSLAGLSKDFEDSITQEEQLMIHSELRDMTSGFLQEEQLRYEDFREKPSEKVTIESAEKPLEVKVGSKDKILVSAEMNKECENNQILQEKTYEQKMNNMENKEDENTKSTRKSKYGILSYLKKKFSLAGLSKDFEDSITQEEQLMIHSELRDMTSGFLQEEQLRYEDFREKPSEKVTIESAEKPLEVKVGSKDKILVSAEMNKECENNQILQEKTYEQKMNNMENKEDENTKSTRKSKYGILSYLKKKFSLAGLSKDFEDSITQEEQLMIHSELRDMTSGFLQEEQLRYEDFREKPSEKVTIESAEKPLEVKVGSKDKILVSAEMNKECENNQILQEKTYEQKMNNMENKEDENTKSTRKSKYGILSYLKKKFSLAGLSKDFEDSITQEEQLMIHSELRDMTSGFLQEEQLRYEDFREKPSEKVTIESAEKPLEVKVGSKDKILVSAEMNKECENNQIIQEKTYKQKMNNMENKEDENTKSNRKSKYGIMGYLKKKFSNEGLSKDFEDSITQEEQLMIHSELRDMTSGFLQEEQLRYEDFREKPSEKVTIESAEKPLEVKVGSRDKILVSAEMNKECENNQIFQEKTYKQKMNNMENKEDENTKSNRKSKYGIMGYLKKKFSNEGLSKDFEDSITQEEQLMIHSELRDMTSGFLQEEQLRYEDFREKPSEKVTIESAEKPLEVKVGSRDKILVSAEMNKECENNQIFQEKTYEQKMNNMENKEDENTKSNRKSKYGIMGYLKKKFSNEGLSKDFEDSITQEEQLMIYSELRDMTSGFLQEEQLRYEDVREKPSEKVTIESAEKPLEENERSKDKVISYKLNEECGNTKTFQEKKYEQKMNNVENKEDENTKSNRKSKDGILGYLKKKFSNEGLSKDFEDNITHDEQLMIQSELRDMTSGFLQEERLKYEDVRKKPSEFETIESAESPIEVKVRSTDKLIINDELNEECGNNEIFQERAAISLDSHPNRFPMPSNERNIVTTPAFLYREKEHECLNPVIKNQFSLFSQSENSSRNETETEPDPKIKNTNEFLMREKIFYDTGNNELCDLVSKKPEDVLGKKGDKSGITDLPPKNAEPNPLTQKEEMIDEDENSSDRNKNKKRKGILRFFRKKSKDNDDVVKSEKKSVDKKYDDEQKCRKSQGIFGLSGYKQKAAQGENSEDSETKDEKSSAKKKSRDEKSKGSSEGLFGLLKKKKATNIDQTPTYHNADDFIKILEDTKSFLSKETEMYHDKGSSSFEVSRISKNFSVEQESKQDFNNQTPITEELISTEEHIFQKSHNTENVNELNLPEYTAFDFIKEEVETFEKSKLPNTSEIDSSIRIETETEVIDGDSPKEVITKKIFISQKLMQQKDPSISHEILSNVLKELQGHTDAEENKNAVSEIENHTFEKMKFIQGTGLEKELNKKYKKPEMNEEEEVDEIEDIQMKKSNVVEDVSLLEGTFYIPNVKNQEITTDLDDSTSDEHSSLDSRFHVDSDEIKRRNLRRNEDEHVVNIDKTDRQSSVKANKKGSITKLHDQNTTVPDLIYDSEDFVEDLKIQYTTHTESDIAESAPIPELEFSPKESKRKPLFRIESEEEATNNNVTSDSFEKESQELDNLLLQLRQESPVETSESTSHGILSVENKNKEMDSVDIETIERKLCDLGIALETLENLEKAETPNNDDVKERKLRRIERRFERMASDTGEKTELTNTSKNDQYQQLVSQLSQEEVITFQGEYINLWDDYTFSKTDEWDSKTPDSQADVLELPQGDIVYMAPVKLNTNHSVNRAGVEVDVIPIMLSPHVSPTLRKNRKRYKSRTNNDRRISSSADRSKSLLRSSITKRILKMNPKRFLSGTALNEGNYDEPSEKLWITRSLDDVSQTTRGPIMNAVSGWLYSATNPTFKFNSELHPNNDNTKIENSYLYYSQDANSDQTTPTTDTESVSLYFNYLDTSCKELTEASQNLPTNIQPPQPRPRHQKSKEQTDEIVIEPTPKQISPVRDDLLDDADKTEDISYQDKKKFWENIAKEPTKKQSDLTKRNSVHEISTPPVPKPRGALQFSYSISESSTEKTSVIEFKHDEVATDQTLPKEEESSVETREVYSSDAQKEIPSADNSKNEEVKKTDSVDTEDSSSQAEDNAGYISDSGDVEHYISDSEIEDRVPQIRERQMSVFIPPSVSQRTRYERSASLPTEDLYEVSARSTKLRKQYYEEQIRKEMIQEQLTIDLEDEGSPERKDIPSPEGKQEEVNEIPSNERSHISDTIFESEFEQFSEEESKNDQHERTENKEIHVDKSETEKSEKVHSKTIISEGKSQENIPEITFTLSGKQRRISEESDDYTVEEVAKISPVQEQVEEEDAKTETQKEEKVTETHIVKERTSDSTIKTQEEIPEKIFDNDNITKYKLDLQTEERNKKFVEKNETIDSITEKSEKHGLPEEMVREMGTQDNCSTESVTQDNKEPILGKTHMDDSPVAEKKAEEKAESPKTSTTEKTLDDEIADIDLDNEDLKNIVSRLESMHKFRKFKAASKIPIKAKVSEDIPKTATPCKSPEHSVKTEVKHEPLCQPITKSDETKSAKKIGEIEFVENIRDLTFTQVEAVEGEIKETCIPQENDERNVSSIEENVDCHFTKPMVGSEEKEQVQQPRFEEHPKLTDKNETISSYELSKLETAVQIPSAEVEIQDSSSTTASYIEERRGMSSIESEKCALIKDISISEKKPDFVQKDLNRETDTVKSHCHVLPDNVEDTLSSTNNEADKVHIVDTGEKSDSLCTDDYKTINQPQENIENTIWEVSVESEVMKEEKLSTLPTCEQESADIKSESLSDKIIDENITDETNLDSDKLDLELSDSLQSTKFEPDTHNDMKKIILESLQQQKVDPEEAKLIAESLIEEIESELQRVENFNRESSSKSDSIDSDKHVTDYLKELAEAKGLEQREVELVESVLERRKRQISRLSRGDTQASSMEITDEDLRYSETDYDYKNILQQQMGQLEAQCSDHLNVYDSLIEKQSSADPIDDRLSLREVENTLDTNETKPTIDESPKQRRDVILEEDETVTESSTDELELNKMRTVTDNLSGRHLIPIDQEDKDKALHVKQKLEDGDEVEKYTTEDPEVDENTKETIKRTSSSDSKSSVGSNKTPDDIYSSCSSSKKLESESSAEVVLRKNKKEHKKTERKSGIELETYSSSGESHYHSFEIDGKSRPCSSDIEGIVPTGSSEYESALNSQELSMKSQLTSGEYHTAISSLSSKESMMSIESESSGNLASIEVSETSETLVPTNSDLEGDIDIDDQHMLEDNDLWQTTESESREPDSEGNLNEYRHASTDAVEIPPKMKRSHEMTFQPEPRVLASDSQQMEQTDIDERLGTSLDDGSALSVSLSSTSSAQLRTVIELSRTESIGPEESITSVFSDHTSLDDDLVKTPENITLMDSSTSTVSVNKEPIESVTILSATVSDNGVKSVCSQVTTETISSSVDIQKPNHEELKRKGHRRQDSTSFIPTLIHGALKSSETPKLHEISPPDTSFETIDREVHDLSIRRESGERRDSHGKSSSTSSEKSSFEEAEAEAAFNMVAHISPVHKIKQICPIIEDIDAEKLESEARETARKEQMEKAKLIRDASPGSIPDIKVTEHLAPLDESNFRYPELEIEREELERETREAIDIDCQDDKGVQKPDDEKQNISQDSSSTREEICEIKRTESSGDISKEVGPRDKSSNDDERTSDSPNSDSFELVEKPDIIDDFVVIEEIGKEASEMDSEGKSMAIQAKPKSHRKRDEELDAYLARSDPTPLTKMTELKYFPPEGNYDLEFEFEDSPPQAKADSSTKEYGSRYDQELEANKKWIEQQFHGDHAAMAAAGYGYEMEFERGPLEDIKEEDINDIDQASSRIGSLGSQKESGGSLGSMKDSYSSTPEYDVLAGRRYFTRSGEHDDVSMSSLQEFENLERAMSLETKRMYHGSGSQESSSNGSFKTRYYASKGQGDDISVSSLKEFEGLEKACIAVYKTEIKVKEEEELLSQIEEVQEGQSDKQDKELIDTSKVTESDEEDYEKRMFEIDEIIRQAQNNVEKFVELKEAEKTESLGRGDSIEEVSKVPDLDLDAPLNKSATWKQEDPMVASTDSLDLDQVKPIQYGSTDSLDQKNTGMDVMTASTDSIEMNNQLSRDITADSIENKTDGTNMVCSDSLDIAAAVSSKPQIDSLEEDDQKIFTDHSSSDTGKDFSSSVKEDADEQLHELMLGSTDSLEPTSSTATHATYQYETDSVFSGSFTSGGSNTMVSSTDTIDPNVARENIDIAAAVRKVWFDEGTSASGKDITTEYFEDSSMPYVTEVIEPSDDPAFSHTIHRRVQMPVEVRKVTFHGKDADQKLEQFIKDFGDDGEEIHETEEVDSAGNVHTRRVVQKRFVVRSDDPSKSGYETESTSISRQIYEVCPSQLTTLTKTIAGESSQTDETADAATAKAQTFRRRTLKYDISVDDQTEVDPREHDWLFNLTKDDRAELSLQKEEDETSQQPFDQHQLSQEMKDLLKEMEEASRK